MNTLMDDLIIVGMMVARIGIPMLVMALLSASLNRVARSSE